MNEIQMKVKHIKYAKTYSDPEHCPLAEASREVFGNKFKKILGVDQIETTEGIFTISPKYPITDYYIDRTEIIKRVNDEEIVREFKLVN